MSEQMQNRNENHSNREQEQKGFGQIVELCRNNPLYAAVAGVCLVLVIILAAVLGGGSKEKPDTETNPDQANTAVTEQQPAAPESYAKDAYPEINELITNYYTAYANGDIDTLVTLADPISDAEKAYISVVSQYVDAYENFVCYTKSGMDENSYIVSVYLDMKFKDVETRAPGLETSYIRKREDGTLYIDNLYGQFNVKREEYEGDPAVLEWIKAFNQQEDVVALQTEVQQNYENALASDEALNTVANKTLPDAILVWASDQEAAARKAEEEAAAAEEAEKKAAEEEAAKKAEEEKKAAELAAAVTVYATDKVNVRAEASETAEVIGQLEAGSQTTRLEDKDGWSRIDYSSGTQGYVKSEYLSTGEPAPAEAEEPEAEEPPASSSSGLSEGAVITIKESVNLRKSMGEDAEKLATIFAGEKVTVIMSYAEGWTKVSYGDRTGFIKTDLLK